MRTPRALGVAAGVATLALLAGCAAIGSSLPGDSAVAPGAPADVGQDRSGGGVVAAPEEVPGGVPVPSVNQKVARTAQLAITVTDLNVAAGKVRDLATAMGGQVTAENLVSSTDGEGQFWPSSVLVITVPADRLDATLDQLKSVGKVTSRVISSEDVTVQVADVDSRISTLNDSISRLRELSEKAGSISELTELEAQLTQRIAERDSLIAQQRALEGRVAQSPVTIILNPPAPPGELETTGFLGGLLAGWNALVVSSRVLLTVLGAVLPFAAVLAVIVVPLVWWRRRVRRLRGGPPRPAPTVPAESTTGGSAADAAPEPGPSGPAGQA